jgi:hypothetical protein
MMKQRAIHQVKKNLESPHNPHARELLILSPSGMALPTSIATIRQSRPSRPKPGFKPF